MSTFIYPEANLGLLQHPRWSALCSSPCCSSPRSASVANSFRIFKGCISVRLIDNRDPKNPTKSSDHWIHTLKTKVPLELVENGLQTETVLCFPDYVYGRTVFGQWFPDMISKFSSFLYCGCRCCCLLSGFSFIYVHGVWTPFHAILISTAEADLGLLQHPRWSALW